MLITNLREKHYKRMKNFLTYDIEERDLKEKKIILEEIQNVAKNMIDDIDVRRVTINENSNIVISKNGIKIEGGIVSLDDVFKTIINTWFSLTEKDQKIFSDALVGEKGYSYLKTVLNCIRTSSLNIGESFKSIFESLDNKEKFYIEIYHREGKGSASIGIFNKDKFWIVRNVYNIDEIIKFIENDILCEKDNSIFYVDVNGLGVSIYDILKHNGYDVRKLEYKILK